MINMKQDNKNIGDQILSKLDELEILIEELKEARDGNREEKS